MAIRTYKVTLDSKNSIASEPVFLRQGDKTGAVVIDATLMDNGAPVSLSGLTPMFKANTADGQAVIADSTGFNVLDSANGEFTYQVPSQLGSVDGKIKIAYFSFSDSSGAQSTFNVVFVVEKAADMTHESAKDWVSNLNEIISQYNQWVNNAHSSWQDFVNENKEIIESIDPGGTLLTEIISARNGKSDLKTRLDDEHAQVTAQLAQKAKQSDLEIERERINNIISLPEGATTNDARLEDIAVGVDGKVYSSPGEAVRTQIDKVNSSITKMSEIQVKWTENRFINPSDGTWRSYPETEILKYWASDFIDISSMKFLYGYVLDDVEGVFYDENRQYMSISSGTNKKRDYINVPIGAKYFRFSKETKLKKYVDYTLFGFVNVDDVQNTITTVDAMFEDYDLSQISMGAGYLMKSGIVANDPTGYSTTDFIPINPFLKTRVLCIIFGTVVLGVFDENKNIIQFIGASDVIAPSLTPQIVEIIPSKNARYIRFTGYNKYSQNISDYYVKTFVSKQGIDMITDEVDSLSKKVDNVVIPDIEIQNNKAFASLSMFKNFAVIGDSYASGEIYVDGNGADYYDLSWGQNIARNCGNECLNLSSGGLTSKKWLTAGKGLPLMKSSDPQGLYMISLGLNDQGMISSGQYELGSISDLNADYTENPDTFYGNYGKIIGNIKDHAPKAKIIICTVTQGRDGDFPIPNGAIPEIANHFSLPLINLRDDYFFTDPFFAKNLVGSHMTATGYSGYALGIMRLFSKCVEEYDSYFADYVG